MPDLTGHWVGGIVVMLAAVREERGLSQNELARRLGMSLNNVQKIEYGIAKSIPLETLDLLCQVLERKPGELLRWEADAAVGEDTGRAGESTDS